MYILWNLISTMYIIVYYYTDNNITEADEHMSQVVTIVASSLGLVTMLVFIVSLSTIFCILKKRKG